MGKNKNEDPNEGTSLDGYQLAKSQGFEILNEGITDRKAAAILAGLRDRRKVERLEEERRRREEYEGYYGN